LANRSNYYPRTLPLALVGYQSWEVQDITSYFDEERRKSILEFFNKRDIQVLISSTDKLDIEAKNFYVEKGIIEDENNFNK